MELSNYLRGVKSGVDNAAALADDETKQVAARLATSVESSVQLALIEALSDATSEISAELAPGSVGMTMRGMTPHFTVTLPEGASESTYLEPERSAQEPAASAEEEEDADDTLVRFSLRLPKWAKDKADKRAEEEGVSTNTWLAERVIRELSSRRGPGPGGPFGPPPFARGPFGPPGFRPGPGGPGPGGRGPGGRGGHRGRPEDRGGRGARERHARAEDSACNVGSDADTTHGEAKHKGKGKGQQFDPSDIGAMIDMASQALRDWTGDGRGRGGRGKRGPGNVQGWV